MGSNQMIKKKIKRKLSCPKADSSSTKLVFVTSKWLYKIPGYARLAEATPVVAPAYSREK